MVLRFDIFRAALAGAVAIGIAALPSMADGTGGTMSQQVRIVLRGEVTPQCMMSGLGGSLDIGRLSAGGMSGQKQLSFQLNCNTPFSYSLTSEHGSLMLDKDGGANGLAARFPYRARLTIPTDGGASLTLDCSGAQLGGDAGACEGQSGAETAIGQNASLIVLWEPIGQHLMPGRYRDELRIAFSIGN